MATRVDLCERGLATKGMAPIINWRARLPATTTKANRLSGDFCEMAMSSAPSKGSDNIANALVHRIQPTTRRYNYGAQIFTGALEIVIDDHKIVLRPATHLLARTIQAAANGFVGILSAIAQALLD